MTNQTFKRAFITGAVALALGVPAVAVADDSTNSKTTTTTSQQSTGKQKATAIGAGTGAVAGAVVGGPVGAVVGAGVGAYVGNKGTDANGRVVDSDKTSSRADDQVRKAQAALNAHGFNLTVDGVYGPNTESAVRSFQGSNGLAQSGRLDDQTLSRLGVKS